MPKLFRGAFWVSVTAFLTKVSGQINQHPRFMRLAILTTLNLAGFFFFWVISYGLFLHLVPDPDHPDYGLMRFGAHFAALVTSLLLSAGLYHLIRGIVLAGKFVSDKISDIGKGLKDGGTVVIEIPKKAVDGAKHGVEVTTAWVKQAGSSISKMAADGSKKCAEVIKEKGPVVGGAILTVAQKSGEVVKESSKKTVDWSKENMPKAADSIKKYASAMFENIAGMFKEKKKNNQKDASD